MQKDELHVGLDIPKQAATEVYNWVQEQDWPEGTELEPLENYHITLLFAQGNGAADHKDAKWITHDSHAVSTKGIKEFPPSAEKDGLLPIVLLVESDTIKAHHNKLAEGAEDAGVDPGPYAKEKYLPHMTIAYGPGLPKGLKSPKLTFETAESSVSTPREETAEDESSREYKERHKNDDHEASVLVVKDLFVFSSLGEPPQVAPQGSEGQAKQEPHPWRIAEPRPYMTDLRRLADSWNPKDQWPYALRERNGEPVDADCTCKDGHKLDCPVHGMHPVLPTYDDTLEFPNPASPVGYDYHGDGPRTWMRAETSVREGWSFGNPFERRAEPRMDEDPLFNADERTEYVRWRSLGRDDVGATQMVLKNRARREQGKMPLTSKVAKEFSEEDWPFMREGCGDYAEALKEAHPALKFGMNYNHVVDEDGDEVLEPVHAFAHDDTHAYDALGKHPLPYNPFNADHTEYDVHPDDIAAADFVQESGEEEPHEHIQRRHPYFAAADPWWHITDNPNFDFDPEHTLNWNSTLGNMSDEPPGLFVTRQPEYWFNGHDYVRPYVAEIHAPEESLDPGYYENNDRVLPAHAYPQAQIKRVIPIDEYVREQYGAPGWIEEYHDDVPYHEQPKYPDYHYEGPDVRAMTSEEQQRHADRTRAYIEGVRPHILDEWDENGERVPFKRSAKAKRKLWLDDTRRPPDDDWDWARNVAEAQHMLQEENREYDLMSLDHDLGMVKFEGKAVINPDALSGGDFCLWLHEHGDKKHMPKDVTLHTHNLHAVEIMYRALEPHTKVKIEQAPDHLEEAWARAYKVHEPSEIKEEEVHLPEKVGQHQLAWLPGSNLPGKGLVTPSGDVHTWPVDKNGMPHHAEYVDSHVPYQLGEGTAHFFKIRPRGGLDTQGYNIPANVISHILRTNPGLHEGESTDWHFGADKFDTREYQDSRMMPPMALEPGATNPHPEKQGCTCDEGHKLDCPVHGLNPTEQGYDHSWSIPQGHPVGYPQDQPRNYMKAEGKVGMAETSGFPELDRHVDEYIQAHPELQELRDPANAWGRCEEASEGLANHLKERGFKAYCTSDELGAFGYKGNQKTEAIGAGDFTYPEHSVVEVYGLYGPNNVNNVTIDLTAAQYGHTNEWPKVHGGPSEYTAAVGDGDGYIECDQGHQHWGVNGAAGLMLRHVDEQGQPRYLLTHRSPAVMHGDTFSVPGGALDSHERPEEGALREAQEELGPIPGFRHTGTETANHGGWAYHTVHGDVPQMFTPRPQNWETSAAQWYTPEQIDQLNLHPGFRAYWEGRRHTAAWHFAKETAPQQIRAWDELKPHPRSGQSVVVHTFPDDWTIQSHPTKFAVQAVGQMLHNCWQGRSPKPPYRPSRDPKRDYMAMHDELGIPRVAFYLDHWPQQTTMDTEGNARISPPQAIVNMPYGPRDKRITPGDEHRLNEYAQEYGHAMGEVPETVGLNGFQGSREASGNERGKQDDAKSDAKSEQPSDRRESAYDSREANEDQSGGVDVHSHIVSRAHPAWLDQWMAQHGPYAYHGSDEDFDAEIARNGLMPWNQIPNYKPGIGQEGELGQPRPNHIYMSTTPPHPEDYSRIYKVDLRMLDPENINPDEDWYADAPGAPPINSYTGQGAEDLGLGDDPAHTHTSMEWGKFSHRGSIPPEAISIHEPPREGDWAMTGLPRAEGAIGFEDDEDEHEDDLKGADVTVPAPPEVVKRKQRERKDQELVEESLLHSRAWQMASPVSSLGIATSSRSTVASTPVQLWQRLPLRK